MCLQGRMHPTLWITMHATAACGALLIIARRHAQQQRDDTAVGFGCQVVLLSAGVSCRARLADFIEFEASPEEGTASCRGLACAILLDTSYT